MIIHNQTKDCIFIITTKKIVVIEIITMNESKNNLLLKSFLAEEKSAILTHILYSYKDKVGLTNNKSLLKLINRGIKYKVEEDDMSLINEDYIQQLLIGINKAPFKSIDMPNFNFIDLFAGIGGFRLAMQNIGGKCVFSSEWNNDAKVTYRENYGETPFGDITNVKIKNCIPEKFDILCAGFPCQAFSIAGLQKGFKDTRGTLFFDIEKIIEKHRPKVVMLENVKNLVTHDNGITFKTILEILELKLGYKVTYKVLNSATHANVPQNRERIFIVAFEPNKVKRYKEFEFPKTIKLTKTIHDFLESGKIDDAFYYKKEHKYYPELEKYIKSSDTIYQWRRVYVRENKNKLCPTLTANMGMGGHNVPLIKDAVGIRKLTPKECFAFQGYPVKKFILPKLANSKLYMQAGNSVTTSLIEKIGKQIINVL